MHALDKHRQMHTLAYAQTRHMHALGKHKPTQAYAAGGEHKPMQPYAAAHTYTLRVLPHTHATYIHTLTRSHLHAVRPHTHSHATYTHTLTRTHADAHATKAQAHRHTNTVAQ